MPTYYSLDKLITIEPGVDKIIILSRSEHFTYVGRIEIPIHLLSRLIDYLEEIELTLNTTEAPNA